MGIGLECFDAQGRLMFSLANRLTRVLGIIIVNAGENSNGSYTDNNLSNGTPFVFFNRTNVGQIRPGGGAVAVTASGNTINWTSGGNTSGFIVYGFY